MLRSEVLLSRRDKETAQDGTSRAVAIRTIWQIGEPERGCRTVGSLVHPCLLAQSVPGDGGAVALHIVSAQIGEQATALADHHQQATA